MPQGLLLHREEWNRLQGSIDSFRRHTDCTYKNWKKVPNCKTNAAAPFPVKEVHRLWKRLAYKDGYEKFKLCLTVLLLLLSFLCYFFLSYRIKGWWVFHHYISAFLSGVMLTWPDGSQYKAFRNQFLAYSLYQSFVQCLQCYYQSGCLYRLRSLGERHNLDLTVEGFQSWMWKGLTFLLPFIFFGHFWQFFNSLSLFRMAQDPACKEWQVLMCALCFLLLFMGNFFTTVAVVHQKLKNGEQILKHL